jgi:hypothetical protein
VIRMYIQVQYMSHNLAANKANLPAPRPEKLTAEWHSHVRHTVGIPILLDSVRYLHAVQ